MAQDAPSDLSITELSVMPTSGVTQGDTVHVVATVDFIGSPLSAGVPVEISWRRIDKPVPCGVTIETFSDAAGPSVARFVETWIDTSDLLPGRYEIAATIDPSNWFPETDEANNRLTISLELLPPRPELHSETIEMTPSSPLLWGETAAVSTLVTNTGQLASGAFHVEFQLFPIQCVDPETGETWRISVSVTGSVEAPAGQWMFVSDANGPHSQAGLAELSAALPEDAWIVFDSVRIPGIDRDQWTEANGAFWTGEAMRSLLQPSGRAAIASSIMVPLSVAEMQRLEGCVTTYAIRALITEPEGTRERDPSNNSMLTSLAVGPSTLDLPELVPVEITFNEALPLDWDNDMDAEVVVMNQGGSAAPLAAGSGGIEVAFYYRRLGDSAWTALDIETIDRLGIEQDTNTESARATIDADPSALGLEPGRYELRVIVDEDDEIPEQNEDNNSLIVGFSVQGTELHPIRLEVPSGAIAQGDTVTVVAIVENTGDRSQSDFNVGFYLDDTRFDTFYYRAPAATEDGLEEDDRARVQGVLDTADLPPETYTLRVIVDPDNRVFESDEGNNEISIALTILPPAERLAELHVTRVEIEPASPVNIGQLFTIAATLRNTGRIGAERFQTEFYIRHSSDGGETWAVPAISAPAEYGAPFYRAHSVNGLSRSAKQVIRETFYAIGWPEGLYQIVVRVDSSVRSGSSDSGEVAELDETNNEMITQFYVGAAAPGGPDVGYPPGSGATNLAVRDLVIAPAETVDVGATIQVAASVANLGGEAAGPFDIEVLWVSPTGASYSVHTQSVGGLGAGEILSIGPVRIDTALPMGLYHVIVSVDTSYQIPEQNELDNELQRSVVVGGGQRIRPDLTPIAVRFAPASGQVEIGDQLYAYVTIRNQGTLASGPFAVSFSTASGTAYEAWGNVEALQDTEVAFAWRPRTAGDFTLTVVIDHANVVEEADESNNTITASYRASELEAVRTAALVQGDSAVSQLLADEATGRIYAAWASGLLAAINPDGTVEPLTEPETGVTITAVRLVDGGQPVAYLGTSIGTISKLDLASGELLAEAFLMSEPIEYLLPTAAGRVLVATGQRLILLDQVLGVAEQVTAAGSILELGYDEYRGTFYVATTAGLYAFDTALTPLCQNSTFLGTLTALAVSPGGVFAGTDAGVIYALGFCTSQNGPTFTMLGSWRYPRTGSLAGPVVSIAVDPRDLDPVYVTDGAGALHALSLMGERLWGYSEMGGTSATMSSVLTIEPRAGRILVGDERGVPYVIDPDGDLVFAVDAAASQGSAIVSNFAVAETREQTAAGTRLVRSYYYGTQDGWIYKFDSRR